MWENLRFWRKKDKVQPFNDALLAIGYCRDEIQHKDKQ
jgi:hypothetical protein